MAAKTIAQLMEEARIRAGAQNYKGQSHRHLVVQQEEHIHK